MRKLSKDFLISSMIIAFFFASQAVAQESTESQSNEPDTFAEVEILKKQVEALQRQLDQMNTPGGKDTVDLSGQEIPFLQEKPSLRVLARPWFQNIDISGFGAANFLGTGAAGTRPDGGFQVKEATLFLEAEAWEDATLFVEIQTNRLGADKSKFIRTGEVYAQFRNVLKKWGDDLLGIKVGRIDIPFGEEYLWQDASDNPLITQSAIFPYGWDEGVLMYGKAYGVGWIAALTDGTDDRSIEDHPSKALNAKVSVNPWESLYLSASFMKNGMAAKSAMEFGGSHFQPVGGYDSSAWNSTSDKVDATMYELNAKYKFGKFGEKGDIAVSYGQAFQDDLVDSFDRDFRWFSVEPLYRITGKIYAVIRYSEIGTYATDKGFHFDGKITAGGNKAFGYDTKLFSRFSFGLGWNPNPRVRVKVEVGRDSFDLIESSTLDPNNDERTLFGIELVSTI